MKIIRFARAGKCGNGSCWLDALARFANASPLRPRNFLRVDTTFGRSLRPNLSHGQICGCSGRDSVEPEIVKLHRIPIFISLAAVLTLSSCVKYQQKTFVNPDKSGKSIIKLEAANALILLGAKVGGNEMKAKEMAEELAKGILGAANGIEAWSDVDYGVGPTGKIKFSGVAYFPNVEKLASAPAGDGKQMPQLSELKSEIVDGKWILRMDLKIDEIAKTNGEPVPADEIEAKIAAQRAEWQTMRGTIGLFLNEMEMKFRLEVAGEVESVRNLERENKNTVSMTLTGKKILDGLETLLMDDAYVRNAMEEGNVDSRGRAIPAGADVAQILLGGDGPAKIVIDPGEPLFDYEAEVAEAKAAMSDELKALIEEGRKLMRKAQP